MVVIDGHERRITGSKNIRQTSHAFSGVNLVENLGGRRSLEARRGKREWGSWGGNVPPPYQFGGMGAL